MCKKLCFFSACMLILTFVLTACGSAENSTPADPGAQASKTGRNGAQPLPEASQLAIGILKLEETELAIDTAQASELLPLWQLLEKMQSSDNAAQEEMDALVDQIRETLFSEQLQAIADMHLTTADLFGRMDGSGPISASPSGTPAAIVQRGGQFQEGPGGMIGGMPGSNPPEGFQGGRQGFNNGEEVSPDQLSTLQANRGSRNGFGGGVPQPILTAVIQLLRERAG